MGNYTAAQQEFLDRTNDFVDKLSGSTAWEMRFNGSGRRYELDSSLSTAILGVNVPPGGYIDPAETVDLGEILGVWPGTFVIPEPTFPV